MFVLPRLKATCWSTNSRCTHFRATISWQMRVGDRRPGMRRVQQGVVGGVTGARGAGGHVDDADGGVDPLAVQHAGEEHRIGFGQIGVPQHEDVGVVDVLVAADRAVEAEAALEAGHRAGGVEARAGLDVVRAQRTLEQLRRDVGVRDGPLGRPVDGDAVLAVLLGGLAEPARHQVERLAQRHLDQRTVAPDHGARDPIAPVERLHRVIALHAGQPLAHR